VAASVVASRATPAVALSCRRCGTLLRGDDPDPVRHQVLEIPPITLKVLEHRLHRLKHCRRPASNRWPTWMKPAPPPAMP
jgi:hypothetical protein